MASLLPFTQTQFLEIFRQYHAGIQVGQALILMMGVVGLSFAFWDNRAAGRVVSSSLAVLWIWMAIVYHVIFFWRIDPVAPVYALLFLGQAAVFLWEGVRGSSLRLRFSASPRGWLGSLVILYALTVYPAMSFIFGHYYPAAPSFGTPNPTVIFTLGLLLWSNASWRVLTIPLVWAIIGTVYAFALDMPQDYALAVAAVLTLVLPKPSPK